MCGRNRRADFLHVPIKYPFLSRTRLARCHASSLSTRSFLSSPLPVASGDYSGRAAIPARERAGLFPVSSHELCVSSVTYRSALPLTGEPECGRSGTFTGQCCQPFCPGDSASHVDGPPSEPSYRSLRRLIVPPGLQAARDPGPPSPPKRDASRTVSTWPLRHRSLPRDAGCIPRRGRVRVKISERVWSRPGRIRLHRTPFDKTAPFTTEPTTPAAHTKHDAQASVSPRIIADTLACASCLYSRAYGPIKMLHSVALRG